MLGGMHVENLKVGFVFPIIPYLLADGLELLRILSMLCCSR